MKKLLTAIFSLLLAACAASPQSVPEPESEGARAFVARCSSCHALPHPARHTAGQWPHIITLMEQRMQERKYVPMSDTERDNILAYLKRNAR